MEREGISTEYRITGISGGRRNNEKKYKANKIGETC